VGGFDPGTAPDREREFASMIDDPQAREMANGAFESQTAVLGEARELNPFGGVTDLTRSQRPIAGPHIDESSTSPH
jgi:hypothetical protein